MKVKWLQAPEAKDYAAAESFVSLVVAPTSAAGVARQLLDAPGGEWKAKDLLRAAELPLLTEQESAEVKQKLAKIKTRAPSPVWRVGPSARCKRR